MSAPDTVSVKSHYQPVSEHDFMSATLLEQVPQAIRESPHRLFYLDAIRAGWSSRQLERYAQRYFGETISRERFRLAAKLFPKTYLLPESYRETLLNGVDAELELVQEVDNLIAVQKVRVTNALAFEISLAKRQEGGGVIPLTATKDEIALLYQMLKDRTNMSINLGLILPIGKGGVAAQVDTVEQEIRETALALTDAQREHLHRAFVEIEGILTTDLPQVEDQVVVAEAAVVSLSG